MDHDHSVEGTSTEVGVISPITDNFCDARNRLRITPDGRLVLCLGTKIPWFTPDAGSDMDSSSLKRAIVAVCV